MTRRDTRAAALAALLALGALASAPSPLDSLAQAERDFARQSVEQGMRAAFDAHFAADGVWLNPHPVIRREDMAGKPAPKTRPPFTLDWYPTFNDVAAAGDFGYSTGPWTVTDQSEKQRPPQHGYFFSIWKRQASGAWKVALDLGVDVPAPSASETPASWRGARHDGYAAKAAATPEAERASLEKREAELRQAVAAKGLRPAYAESLAADFRVYRENHLPYVDAAGLGARLEEEQARGVFTWEPTRVDVARSADLGYTLGSYSLSGQDSAEKGYYVHVWRRTATGDWKLAIEVIKPLPPPPPPEAAGKP